MNEQTLWRRYALALALVDDVDVAGDLFMDSPSEESLRRRAAAWRRQHGLPPAVMPQELPELTPEQQAHALHLHRRARLRRRVQLGLAGVAAAAFLVGALVVALPAGRSPLSADPAFSGRPAGQSEEKAGRRMTVLKAEATAGAVTVWWEITGPGLGGAAAAGVAPELVLSGSGSDWRAATQTQSHLIRPDRLVGKSTYNVLVGGEEAAVLHLEDLGGEPVRWLVRTPLTLVEAEPGARVLRPDAAAELGSFRFTVRQVTVAPTYTLVRYQPRGSRHALQHSLRVEAGGVLLEPVEPPRVEGREVVALFGAVPAEAEELVVHFDRAALQPAETGPSREELIGTTWLGQEVVAQLALSTYLIDRYTASPLPLPQWPWDLEGSYFLRDDGARYPATVIYQGEDPSRYLTLWRLQAVVPPGEERRLLQVRIPRLVREPGAAVRIGLSQ